MFWIRLKNRAVTETGKHISDICFKSDQIEAVGEVIDSNGKVINFIRLRSGLQFKFDGDVRKFLLEFGQADARTLLMRNEIVDFTELI